MSVLSGIYPVGDNGPQLSDTEAALLAALPAQARRSRLATHAELRAAIVAMARRHDYSLVVDDYIGTGFTATIARELRVVANVRGNPETGAETFYCQTANDRLLRQLAEEIARTCGPQLLLPAIGGDEGMLVIEPGDEA